MSSWFGFGGKKDSASADSVPSSTAFTSDATSQQQPASSQQQTPITVSDMFADLHSNPAHLASAREKLAPALPSVDDVELLYLSDNPFGLPGQAPPTGTFGPLPMRTKSDKLLYGVGTAYLGGLMFGGGYGALRGLRTAQVPNVKVRMNNMLNQTTRYGPWAANSMGVLRWAMLDSGLEAARGESDYYNHIGAAFASGMIFKCTAGLRPALLMGSMFASVIGAYGVWDRFLSREDGLKLPSISRPQSASA
ncbi:Mitochondrial import inner membrane translocase subunit tim23 [Geranomyces michiganensis]|nr:Mitochondrial import inner membrane translocase subunit tim23 [Geranomyces michiganensis]